MPVTHRLRRVRFSSADFHLASKDPRCCRPAGRMDPGFPSFLIRLRFAWYPCRVRAGVGRGYGYGLVYLSNRSRVNVRGLSYKYLFTGVTAVETAQSSLLLYIL